jgi:hypothetical protein
LVNVDRVFTGREIFEIEPDPDALLRFGERRGADTLSLRVFHVNLETAVL